MDERQIAFIICINDEEEYAECRYYLNRLQIPEGYSTDIIEIREAPSMAAGYNAGMRSSDAKYKVYLHQDVFIKYTDFLTDLLNVFACDDQIGLLGMIGNKDKVSRLMEWNTGKVTDNRLRWECECPSREEGFVEVQAVDGLLLATQYDILWREDLFDGWDLYDASQVMEFKRAGYKAVVPWQEKAWCYHDNGVPDMTAYYDYYKVFAYEYGGGSDLLYKEGATDYSAEKRYAHQMLAVKNSVKELFDIWGSAGKERLRAVFQEDAFRKSAYLKEYIAIIRIDWLEELHQSETRLWTEGMSVSQLLSSLRILRHALKRIEYGADSQEKELIQKNYSIYAVEDLCERYVVDQDRVRRVLEISAFGNK